MIDVVISVVICTSTSVNHSPSWELRTIRLAVRNDYIRKLGWMGHSIELWMDTLKLEVI